MADLLARAFVDGPLLSYLVPDAGRRTTFARRLFAAVAADGARHGRIDVSVKHGQVVGAAVWMPPGAYPSSLARRARLVALVAPSVPAILARSPAVLRLYQALEAFHPPQRHWYLSLLAVEAQDRRAGIGRSLLAHGLERVDGDGVPSCLETFHARTLPLYERAGFTREATLDHAATGLRAWFLVREASPRDAAGRRTTSGVLVSYSGTMPSATR